MKMVPGEEPLDDFSGIAVIAEAPGDVEVARGRPLVGPSGNLLNRCLRSEMVKLPRTSLYLDNLFQFQLEDNDVGSVSVGKVQQRKQVHGEELPPAVSQEAANIAYQNPVDGSNYLDPEYWPWLDSLKKRLEAIDGLKLVVTLGATATWALTGQCKIGKMRGNAVMSELVPGLKVLPTYHPAYILRNYPNRIVLIRDLRKAKDEAQQPGDVITTSRELWMEPTIEDLRRFKRDYIEPGALLGCDIETSNGQIECIGFSTSPHRAIVVPFIDYDRWPPNYWTTAKKEQWALEWCAGLLEDPDQPILGQNFVYDVRWLFSKAARPITVRNYSEDTRLQHHSLYPELPKDLGFLTSIYAKERSFKHLGKEAKQDG
jgi:uracil-DNA glycosylase